jgi:diguanylate cyclase (GGDEF)-like protein
MPQRWPDNGYPEQHQLGWYRLSLHLDPHALDDHGFAHGLGLRMGKVMSAYEVYANGRLLGGVGRLPPLARFNYDREAVHFVPRDLIGPDGELVLAVRVWGGSNAMARYWGGGPYRGRFSLGEYSSQVLGSIATHMPSLVLCALILGFGVYNLYLYQRNRQLKLYLWFGLTAVNVAVYSLMLTQWKYQLPLTFETLKSVEYGAVFMLPAVALQMLWALLGTRVSGWMRLYQFSFALFAFAGVTDPWPDTRPLALNYFQVWVLPVLFLGPMLIWNSMRAGNAEARTLFLGLIVFAATCINDILSDLARFDSPRMIHYGFAVVVVAMAVSLGNRFTTMLNRLEREVAERTDDLRRANEQLAEVARLDPLTGLLNRRGFTGDAQREIQRVIRGSNPFSIVLADFDHFKQINDRFGHSCGDKVLCRVTRVLNQRRREVDLLGRWGGEEFILLLPETDGEGAAVAAESLRRAVEKSEFAHDGEVVSLTMTLGVATYRPGDTLDAVIHRADAALYHGKKAGRNRVMIGAQGGLSVIH